MENLVADTIYKRVRKAILDKAMFRCIVVLPVHPGRARVFLFCSKVCILLNARRHVRRQRQRSLHHEMVRLLAPWDRF